MAKKKKEEVVANEPKISHTETVIDMFEAGKQIDDIIEETGIKRNTVRTILIRNGMIDPQPRKGGSNEA